MTTFADHFDLDLDLGGLWLPRKRQPDYFPGHADYADDHQLEMWDALHGDADVIVNSNPTGAGKTWSWAVPTIRSGEDGDGWIVIVTYPTNALLEDQKRTLRNRLLDYYEAGHSAVPDVTVSRDRDGAVLARDGHSVRLSDLVRPVSGGTTRGRSTGDVMDETLREAEEASRAGFPVIILTTPDVVSMLGAGLYGNPDANVVPGLVDAIVVDEFHLANPRGKRLLPFYLDLYMRIPDRYLDTLVFLSATPDEDYVNRLQNAFDVRVIGRRSANEPKDGEYRQILPESQLLVRSGNSIFRNAAWIEDRAGDLLRWYDGRGQLLVIVDAVREVETVAEELDDIGGYDVGKVYGWKKRGRQEIIEHSDVIVGNTAMEVGVDFDCVSHVVCTAYDASSAIQRIGRMRAREGLDDQAIALITTSDAHTAIVGEASSSNRIEREQLSTAISEGLDPIRVAPYYESLCCIFTRYLWEYANDPLNNWIHDADAEVYRRTAADHFGHALGADDKTETVWAEAGEFLAAYESSGEYPVFEEMLTFRPSSLTILVLDVTDPEERIKTADLRFLCRNRRGTFVDSRSELLDRYRATFGAITEADQRLAEEADRYSCGYFVSTGTRADGGGISIRKSTLIETWQSQRKTGSPFENPPQSMSSPPINVPPDLLDGVGRVEFDTDMLAMPLDEAVNTARDRYQLGPYADLLQLKNCEESLALWQDAVLVHASEVSAEYDVSYQA